MGYIGGKPRLFRGFNVAVEALQDEAAPFGGLNYNSRRAFLGPFSQ